MNGRVPFVVHCPPQFVANAHICNEGATSCGGGLWWRLVLCTFTVVVSQGGLGVGEIAAPRACPTPRCTATMRIVGIGWEASQEQPGGAGSLFACVSRDTGGRSTVDGIIYATSCPHAKPRTPMSMLAKTRNAEATDVGAQI